MSCAVPPTRQRKATGLTATAADGLVWLFDVTPGPVELSGQLADETPLRARGASVLAGTVISIGLEP
jgi:hypothetical protein